MFHYQRKTKEPNFFQLVMMGLMASSPLTRPFLKLKKPKIVDKSVTEPTELTEQTPVIYVHGFRGGEETTNELVFQAERDKGKEGYLKLIIDLHGNIEVSGTYTGDANPLIQLVFKQKLVGVFAISYYLKMAYRFLYQKYHFQHFHGVGHSLGAPSLVRTEMLTYRKKNFPHLDKVVLIAGPFDGVTYLGDLPNVNQLTRRGRPLLMNTSYLSMLFYRRRFNRDIKVMNIYGNIEDETNTDQFISVISAKSIRYILAPIVSTFHELEVRGPAAEHSQLHDNPLVVGIINHFLNFNQKYVD